MIWSSEATSGKRKLQKRTPLPPLKLGKHAAAGPSESHRPKIQRRPQHGLVATGSHEETMSGMRHSS